MTTQVDTDFWASSFKNKSQAEVGNNISNNYNYKYNI